MDPLEDQLGARRQQQAQSHAPPPERPAFDREAGEVYRTYLPLARKVGQSHHLTLRLPQSRLVRQARRFGRLVAAVALAYWFVCLIGLHALPAGYQRQVTSWGGASVFRLALELLTVPPSDLRTRLDRLLDRVAWVLAPSRIDPPSWRPHYHRVPPRYAWCPAA